MTETGKLVVVRHGESEWNALGKWTGWTDIKLSKNGHEQAMQMGEKLLDIHFNHAFTSDLLRAQQTLTDLLKTQGQTDLPFTIDASLKERDYGDYTAMNKWEVKEKVGEQKFNAIRRGWQEPVPNGETLHDVYDRVIPYFKLQILPRLTKGENILISAHGNSIRALIKYIENLSDQQIEHTEMPLGKILIYSIDSSGKIQDKHERQISTAASKA